MNSWQLMYWSISTENQLFTNQKPGNGGFNPWNHAAIPLPVHIIPRNGERQLWNLPAIPVSNQTIPWKDEKNERNDDLIPNNAIMQQWNDDTIPVKKSNHFIHHH